MAPAFEMISKITRHGFISHTGFSTYTLWGGVALDRTFYHLISLSQPFSLSFSSLSLVSYLTNSSVKFAALSFLWHTMLPFGFWVLFVLFRLADLVKLVCAPDTWGSKTSMGCPGQFGLEKSSRDAKALSWLVGLSMMEPEKILISSNNEDGKETTSKKLCIQDENGKVFQVHSFNVIADPRKNRALYFAK